MLNTDFNPWPSFSEHEAELAANVIRSNKVNYWTGQEGRLFEKEFAAYVDCKHAVAVANGTLALELALEALGIKAGDEVITTPRTFIASASAIVMRGATPVLADVDIESQNITAETIEAVVTKHTKAIIAVHLAGWPCEMDKIMSLAERHGLKVIEDCAQAHGARYKGKPVGAWGDLAAFSFCQDKIMTTGGEGGMLVTNDEALWKKAWAFKDHGKSYDAVYNQSHAPGFRWLHESFGTNWRLTEVQSAIGRYQLTLMSDWTKARTNNAAKLQKALSPFSCVKTPVFDISNQHAYYKFYAFVQVEHLASGWTRDRVVECINAAGVPCFTGSCSEIYLEKAFDTLVKPQVPLPVAKVLGETSIMFLVHPTLSAENMNKAVKVIEQVMVEAQK